MCHRQLRFVKSVECGHLTFTSETNIDCRERLCYRSSFHPSDCGQNGKPKCECKRYYTQPERIVEGEVDGKCAICVPPSTTSS